MQIAKKGTGVETVTHAEALDSALAYGWIDAVRHGLDATYFLQRFTRRRPRSRWSQVNCEKVARLSEAGRMRPAGLAAVAQAKADGRWGAAYEPQSRATVPADLAAALAGTPKALACFESLDSHNRYAVLYRVAAAKRSDTRARRIEQFVAMLAAGDKLHR